MSLIDIIKFYFITLGEELGELFSNIWNNIKTVKWIIILSSILVFTIGCFIWKPLFPISIVGFMMLMISICVMLIPITCSVLSFILFHLDCLDNEEAKYPILQLTLGVICSIVVLCGTSYLAWDIALKDMWINPEMWNELLNL
jgi:xanthine/uracil permease